MTVTVPTYLESTDALVNRAYPDGVDPGTYDLLLRVFYHHLCDGNLAILAAHWSGKDIGFAINDVLAAGETCVTQDSPIPDPLLRAGFEEWSKEEWSRNVTRQEG